ncbi:MAG TPA: zinc-ribbon domain-containing protein [Methanosarcinaceae archaeon]|nr:zinc-ribbon domain-containing protein [Methanosarcinaceae archaeon]
MVFKWKKQIDDIARVISKKDVGGVFSKSVVISPNEKAVIIRNGVVKEIIDSGKLRVGGLLKPGNIGKDVDVALMDTSPKDLDWEHADLWTADNQKVGCGGILRFKMQDPKRFFQMLFAYTTPDKKGGRVLSVQDIYGRLESETISRVLEPEIKQVTMDNVYGNRDLQLKLENELEMQLKTTLSMWGLELLRYTVQWDLGDYVSVLDASNKYQTDEELKEMDTLAAEGDLERMGREDVAKVRGDIAPEAAMREHGRAEGIKDARHEAEISTIENEADAAEARQAIDTFKSWKDAKTDAKRAEMELDEDMTDRKHGRDMEYLKSVTETGGADVANTIVQGRELSGMSPEQLEALAKMKETEARAKEDKVQFMMDVEDRERADANRRMGLDADLMGAAKPMSSARSNMKKCSSCGAPIPADASFCGKCGAKV